MINYFLSNCQKHNYIYGSEIWPIGEKWKGPWRLQKWISEEDGGGIRKTEKKLERKY